MYKYVTAFILSLCSLIGNVQIGSAQDTNAKVDSISIILESPRAIISPSGRMFASVDGRTLGIWSADELKTVGAVLLADKDKACEPIVFSPDERLLICWSADHYLTIDIDKRAILYRTAFAPPAHGISHKLCSFVLDGSEIAMLDDKDGVNVIEARRGDPHADRRLSREKLKPFFPVAMLSAGKVNLILIDLEGRTITWNLQTSKPVTSEPSKPLPITAEDPFQVDVSLDGRVFVYTGNGNFTAWNLVTHNKILHFSDKAMFASSVSPEGSWLATGSTDGRLKLKSLKAKADVELAGVKGDVLQLSWSADESKLLALTDEGRVHVYRLDQQSR